MKIAIVTNGRFHVLDLARELSGLGHEVSFYSYVPLRRAQKFGLPAQCHRALLPYVAPAMALHRLAPAGLKSRTDHLLQIAVDRAAAHLLTPCDVFIGMSGVCVESARRARDAFGARIILERGSRHILSQKEILAGLPGAGVPSWAVSRELWGYDFADIINVPSHHTESSFLERGFAPTRLFRNPYGVDLAMFQPSPVPALAMPTAIFVGGWSLRKGCDLLWEACRRANSWRLVHVGAVLDAPLPNSPLFEHHEPVSQEKLAAAYGKANIFIHASREEGLSLVQAQALACGLPLVCTDRTGGEDLRDMLDDPSWITVVPHDDPAALDEGIARAFGIAGRQSGLRDILGGSRAQFSWRAYGKRYHDKLVSG